MKAFTLLETLLVFVLIAIMTLLAVPSINSFLLIHRTTEITTRLTLALQFAKLEAIRRHEIVTIYPSDNSNWNKGQIIIANKKILRVLPALPQNITLTWQSSLGKNNYLQFAPTGFTNGQQGSFYICSSDTGRTIIINHSGRIRTTQSNTCH